MSKDILNGMSEEEIKRWRNVVTKATNGRPEKFSEILYRKRLVDDDFFDYAANTLIKLSSKIYHYFKDMKMSKKKELEFLSFNVTLVQLLLDHLALESKIFVLGRAILTAKKYEDIENKFTKAFLEEFKNEKR